MANAPVLVKKKINIKVLVDLKLPLRRHTGTLYIDLNKTYSFFMYRIEKIYSVGKISQI